MYNSRANCSGNTVSLPVFSPSVSIKYVRWIIVKQSNKRA
uniref:Uncharacterized protein n=1 Tax=Geladintestivirus 1 TaxID=3233133 RepID=A0AAU8MHW3_9CAUD